MNADQMLDYVLGRLEGNDLHRLEQTLRTDPDAQETVDRLRTSILLLLDDGEAFAPPAGLARRTLAAVASARTRPRSILDLVPARIPFRRADLAVAASILIAGFLTLVPAIQQSRERMNQAGCTFNLQQLGSSLAQYVSFHPYYPYPSAQEADAHSGTFAAFLHDAGMLPDLRVLDCPHNGPSDHLARELPSFEELERLRRSEPDRYDQMFRWDYAYNVGHLDRSGRPSALESRPPMVVPVVADAPSHERFARILDGNSPNHAHRGQNVLFSDSSVRFCRNRWISDRDPDFYLNNHQAPEPGIDASDSVLVPSHSPFSGLRGR